MSILDKFNRVDLHGKTVLLFQKGEYISGIDYYSLKVNLYTMPGFLVELAYSPYLDKIEKIEVITDNARLTKHLVNIEIETLLT
ncbi:MAG: hypothetical protein ABL895_16770 [Cyclobacteriaceae bacterium]